MKLILLAIVTVIGLSGCSTKMVYESLHKNYVDKCLRENRHPPEVCRERANKTYEQYRSERKRVIEDKD